MTKTTELAKAVASINDILTHQGIQAIPLGHAQESRETYRRIFGVEINFPNPRYAPEEFKAWKRLFASVGVQVDNKGVDTGLAYLVDCFIYPEDFNNVAKTGLNVVGLDLRY